MRGFIRIFAIVFLLAVTSVCSQSKKAQLPKRNEPLPKLNLSVRYIANEGVLISSGDKTILIDGLHREYKPAYLFPPADLLKSLENAEKPYDKINLLLVSHIHSDHFHPHSIGLHLKNNPRVALASSEQVVGEVAKDFADYEKIKSQIKPVAHEWKKTVELNHGGVKIKFLGLRHVNKQHASIQNLGHLIEIDGKKLLHIGDADMTAENFSAFNLAQEKIDIAFIPYWFLLTMDGLDLVQKQFNPKYIVAVHISPDDAERISAQFKEDMPDVVTFTKVLEEKSF
jgi:L-ascorbate metabolism protein UlaG (beta-lactamase superfamily)